MNTIEIAREIKRLREKNSFLSNKKADELNNTLIDSIADGEISGTIFDENAIEEGTNINVKTSYVGGGVFLTIDGYTDAYTDVESPVVKLDYFEGEMSVIVWGDKEKEDYTHKVNLIEAKIESETE